MVATPVYLDNHSTTRVDPRVVEVMTESFLHDYGNAGSTSHVFGWQARDQVAAARKSIASHLGAKDREIVFTSGATESNNLAIRGLAEWKRRKGNHIVSVSTEHKAVLDPLARLARRDIEVDLLKPILNDAAAGDPPPGWIDPQQVADAIRDDTFLVSIMLANNEIGIIQPLAEIGAICKERGVLLHCDATQAVGRIPVHVEELQVDLLSFSAHKLYGPKGAGALYVRRSQPHVRLAPQIEGGGQEKGLRSGTLAVPGILGFAKAVELAVAEIDSETIRLAELRNRLMAGLTEHLEGVRLNGPKLSDSSRRLAGNLNVRFEGVDGEALMMSMQDLAVSSGSACTSANPEPSHVLRAVGLSDDQTRSSLRFGIGRFNTAEEIEFAIQTVADTVHRLRKLGSG